MNRGTDELMSVYFDGELSPAEEAEVEQALRHSRRPRQLLEQFRGLRRLLRSMPRHRLDPNFPRRVLGQVEASALLPLEGLGKPHPLPQVAFAVRRLARSRLGDRFRVVAATAILAASISVLAVVYRAAGPNPSGPATASGVDSSARPSGVSPQAPGPFGNTVSERSPAQGESRRTMDMPHLSRGPELAESDVVEPPDAMSSLTSRLELSFVCDLHSAEALEQVLGQFEQILASQRIDLQSQPGVAPRHEQIYVIEASAQQLTGTLTALERLAEESTRLQLRQLAVAQRRVTASAAGRVSPPAAGIQQRPAAPRPVALSHKPSKGQAMQLGTETSQGAADTVDPSREAVLHTQRAMFIFRVAAPSSDSR
jgi:hypothetical protein